MHVILTGATGLVGSAVLDAMIKMKDISKISVISRRPVKMAEEAKDPRVNVILHRDFETYPPELLSQLSGATGCVWALGVSQNAVGKEEYVRITKTYALEAAKAFRVLTADADADADAYGKGEAEGAAGRPFHFVYVSGDGTTLEPGAFTPIFARVKGETEVLLAKMREETPLLHTSSVRPCFIDFAHHDAIKPYVPVQGVARDALIATLGPVIRGLAKSKWSPTVPLGSFLVEMALGRWEDKFVGTGFQKVGESGFAIVENVGFRRLAGLQ